MDEIMGVCIGHTQTGRRVKALGDGVRPSACRIIHERLGSMQLWLWACPHATHPQLYSWQRSQLLDVELPVVRQGLSIDHGAALCRLAHVLTVVSCFAGRSTERAADAVDPAPRAWPTAEVTPNTSPVPTTAPEGDPQSAVAGQVASLLQACCCPWSGQPSPCHDAQACSKLLCGMARGRPVTLAAELHPLYGRVLELSKASAWPVHSACSICGKGESKARSSAWIQPLVTTRSMLACPNGSRLATALARASTVIHDAGHNTWLTTWL